MKQKYTVGFTLVEVMVVVAILAIIAAIGLPSYRRYQDNAQQKVCTDHILAARLLAIDWIAANDYSVDGMTTSTLGPSATNDACTSVKVTIKEGALSIAGTAAVGTFTMTRSAGNGRWSCQLVDKANTVIAKDNCAAF